MCSAGKKRKKAAKRKAPPKEERVEMTPEEHAAHDRLRAWMRTHLDALEIWAHGMDVGRACAGIADRAAQLQPVMKCTVEQKFII